MAPDASDRSGPAETRAYADDRVLLEAAAKSAGEIAMSHFRTDVAFTDKPDDAGPVSQADLEINTMLADMLRQARPDYGWLSEESEDSAARLSAERVFIIDPIDGTRAFIAGEKGFSVAIAVVERGEVTAAAVHLPAREEMFTAALGQGATKNGDPIAVSSPETLSGATVLTSRWQMEERHWPGGVPPIERHFRSSLAWRMCLIAEGRFDAMLTFRRSYEWDIAAGALILGEAGAAVTDGGGDLMRFNSPDAMQQGVIAAAPGPHAKLMHHRLGPDAA